MYHYTSEKRKLAYGTITIALSAFVLFSIITSVPLVNQFQFSHTTVAAKSYESAIRDKQLGSENERLPTASFISEDEAGSRSVMSGESQPSSSTAASAPKTNNSDTRAESREMLSSQSQASLVSPPTSAPSTLSQDGSDFTTQALSSLTARPTNNIVNTNSFYDIVFLTGTAGAIKTIQVTFPAGTTVPTGASFNEAEGVGPGTVSKSGQTLTYTVTNAVNVPAGTKIRLEFANLNNPLNPSSNYKVTVTTRTAANVVIDGPTQSASYTVKQIGANVIANNAVTTPKIADFSVTNSKLGTFSVTNSKLNSPSVTSDKVFPGSFSLPVAQRPGPAVNLPPGVTTQADASCLSGEQIIGGGHLVIAPTNDVRDYRSLGGFIQGNSWRASAINAGAGTMTFQSFAECALDFPL